MPSHQSFPIKARERPWRMTPGWLEGGLRPHNNRETQNVNFCSRFCDYKKFRQKEYSGLNATWAVNHFNSCISLKQYTKKWKSGKVDSHGFEYIIMKPEKKQVLNANARSYKLNFTFCISKYVRMWFIMCRKGVLVGISIYCLLLQSVSGQLLTAKDIWRKLQYWAQHCRKTF